jgi:ABC-2 type transport system ATP-binding protein
VTDDVGNIVVSGLTKTFGTVKAVDNLSFEVPAGTITGFLGPNGAGKTTTLRCLLGLVGPTGGTATIGGRTYRDLARPAETVGAMLEASSFHPARTGRNHLLVYCTVNGFPDKRADEVLDLVGLTKVAKRRAGGFSLGMSQRLGIAGALLGDPKVLLFDEPVNGLDPEGILWIRQFMQGLATEGRTVLVSSHLLSEMALTASDLVVIGKGKLISQSSTTEFVERSAENTVRVRSPHADKLGAMLLDKGFTVREGEDGALTVSGASSDQIGDIAASAGVVLHELSPQRGSLEEAFMQLTGDSVEYHAAETGK